MTVVYGQRQISRILVYEREGNDEEEDKKGKGICQTLRHKIYLPGSW